MRAIARERCIEIEGYTLTRPTPPEGHHWLWKNSVPASYQSQSPTSFTVNPRSQWARVGLRYCRMTSVDIGRHLRNRAPRCVKQPPHNHLFSYHARRSMHGVLMSSRYLDVRLMHPKSSCQEGTSVHVDESFFFSSLAW